MNYGWPPLQRWQLPRKDMTEFSINPGVNRYFIVECLSERYPNMKFHILSRTADIVTVFQKLDENMKAQIDNDIQVLCIAYQVSKRGKW